MGSRGRKSAASQMVLSADVQVGSRPDAPYTLTDEEADEWRAIVAVMEPDYFARTHYPLLSQLCRHIVASNRISQLVEATCKPKKVDQTKLQTFMAMQNKESESIIRLCRQLRLSHQAVYRQENKSTRPLKTIDVPWKRQDDDD